MLFFGNEVRKGVMKIVDERIKVAQQGYEDECAEFDLDYEEAVAKAEEEREFQKTQSLNNHIKSIIGKIL